MSTSSEDMSVERMQGEFLYQITTRVLAVTVSMGEVCDSAFSMHVLGCGSTVLLIFYEVVASSLDVCNR